MSTVNSKISMRFSANQHAEWGDFTDTPPYVYTAKCFSDKCAGRNNFGVPKKPKHKYQEKCSDCQETLVWRRSKKYEPCKD